MLMNAPGSWLNSVNSMKHFFSILVLTTLCLVRGMASPIDAAISAYEGGDYELAVREFRTAIATSPPSAALYYNLGMALKRSKQLPQAALAFQRALLLDPLSTDARIALSDVERSLNVPLRETDWRDWVAERIPLQPFMALSFVVFWFSAFLILALAGFKKKRVLSYLLAISLLVLAAATFSAFYLADPRFRAHGIALVVTPDPIPLNSTPTTRSETVAQLSPGSPVHVIKERGGWIFVRVKDGRSGWLPASAVAALIPGAGDQGAAG